MSARTIAFGSATIEYLLTPSPCRSLSITVRPDGAVEVRAPEDALAQEVDERVRRRARWILKQQRRFDEFRPRTPPRTYVGGETHRYLGRQYRLKIVATAEDKVGLRSGRLVVETRFPADAGWTAMLVRGWLRRRAAEVLRERFTKLAPVMRALGVEPPPLRVCAMTKRWGSHTPSGRIILNDSLIGASRDCIDYVIVHELCHVIEPNHSPPLLVTPATPHAGLGAA